MSAGYQRQLIASGIRMEPESPGPLQPHIDKEKSSISLAWRLTKLINVAYEKLLHQQSGSAAAKATLK